MTESDPTTYTKTKMLLVITPLFQQPHIYMLQSNVKIRSAIHVITMPLLYVCHMCYHGWTNGVLRNQSRVEDRRRELVGEKIERAGSLDVD